MASPAAMAADAGERSSAAVRLRLAWRVVRAAELLALAFLASRSFPRLPYAAAAASSALRVAASLLLHPRSVFLIANAIVLLLFLFSRRDPSSSSAPSSSDQDHFLSFAGQPLLLPSAADSPAPASGPDAVFEDKQAVHVTTVRAAAAPRRSRSEKISGGTRSAGSPDMRRSESDNGRRRRRSTSSAVPEEWGGAEDDDEEEEEFRRAVEAFIAKQQTRFHREESFGLVAGEDAQAIAVAAAVSPVK